MLAERRPGRRCSPAQLRTVLNWVIRSHNDQIVESVLAENAPLDPAGSHRRALSALGAAVESRFDAIIPRLLEAGARQGPWEFPGILDIAILSDQPEVVELLLEHSLWLTCDAGLIQITMTNDKPLLLLLDYGLDLNQWGVSAFFTAIIEFAVGNGYEEDVALLEKFA